MSEMNQEMSHSKLQGRLAYFTHIVFWHSLRQFYNQFWPNDCGPVDITPQKFDLGLPSTLIRRENGDFGKHSSNLRNLKTPASLRFSAHREHFENEAHRKRSCNISNTRDSVSSGYPNTEKRVENTTRSRVFLTKFEVF